MQCTSASMACCATSSGVWNSGPMSTSKPRSANPVAITLAPRSCPSWPSLATRMRGRRPSLSANECTILTVWSNSVSASAADVAYCAEYAPWTTFSDGLWRPHTRSRASEISPTVHRARAASTASASRLFGLSPAAVLSASAAALLSDSSTCRTRALSRFARRRLSASVCSRSTVVLSMSSTSTCVPSSTTYLLMPTTTSAPLSMRACLRAAASSMRSLGMPLAMALAMPPMPSTSLMISSALSASCLVIDSIMYEPPNGSATRVMLVSSWMMSCVLRAICAEKLVGSPSASSNAFVCSDCVPPSAAAMASIAVRTTLLYGLCAVSE
mmetsp:Transcript_7849/g.24632  ORF Transcript_7849/g.24632 Transcript_7849/m.24632 type:complete len:327 (+) Transcript_7849:1-981(+)